MSFFPQLIAGPIQRAKDLIPQFTKERIFNVEIATSGMQQILWGLFKKVVIADVCAIHCNEIFNDYEHYSSIGLIVGAVYFSFQIYGDFSGYTDIACGVAKLFGFSFFNNFNYPYFAESISSFWRKWHISLTTWFKDYIYIPLGGNKKGRFLTLFNSSVIFLISGFWHGANWTYVLWGMLNLVYFIPSILFPEAKNNKQDTRWYIRLFNIVSTFSLITFAWIFFRADSIGDAFNYIKGILSLNFHHIEYNKFEYIPLIVLLVIWEWFHKETDNPLALQNTKQWIRWLIYFIVCWLILFFWGEEVEFIYFQF